MLSDTETTAVAFVTKEVTFIDPLIDQEALLLMALAATADIKPTISHSARIATFPCDELQDVISLLDDAYLIENIARIREIVDWDIVNTNSHPDFLDIILKPEGNDNA